MRQIVHGESVSQWVANHQRRGDSYGPSMGIGMLRDGKMIAGCVFHEWNGTNVVMHVASIEPHWMTRRFLFVCFDYPFNQMKVKRITGFVEDDNEAALRLDKHLGFQYETRLSDAYTHGDHTGDIIVLVMRREDCRFISTPCLQPIALAA